MARDSFRTSATYRKARSDGARGGSRGGTREGAAGHANDSVQALINATPEEMADAVRARVSLVKRAMKRRASIINGGAWWVAGDPKLGDKDEMYLVQLPEDSVRYDCSCYHALHGEVRQARRCSHVLAVILCRRGYKEWDDRPQEWQGWNDSRALMAQAREGLDATDNTEASANAEGIENTPTEEDALPSPERIVTFIETPFIDTHSIDRASAEPPSGSGSDAIPATVEAAGQGEGDMSGASHDPDMHATPSPTLPDDDTEPPMDDEVGEGTQVSGLPSNVIAFPSLNPLADPPMPSKFRGWRNGQEEAIQEVVEHFRQGRKVVFLEAPTGSGKTFIGEGVRRYFSKSTRTATYNVVTKSLQEQILRDFSYARVIKGKSNYPTINRPDATCDDCDGSWSEGPDSCSLCPDMNHCPYVVAKRAAVRAELPVLNMAYFLNESQGARTEFGNRRVAILDEGDELETVLRGFMEVSLTPRMRREIGVTTSPKKTVEQDWKRWIEEDVIPPLVELVKRERAQGSLFGDTLKQKRKIRRLMELRDTLIDVARSMEHGDDAWILSDYDRAKTDDDATYTFKPVTVNGFARQVLWNKAEHFLVMSATVISAEQMAQELGLEDHEWAFVRMDSIFPAERRPIIYRSTVAMSHKTKDTTYPVMTDEVERIIAENPGVRILVHTVSYGLAKHLYSYLKSPRVMTYFRSEDREAALAEFLATKDAVMLAPSFERGIDLPGDKCEVIIIPKVPFPNLGDKQVRARFHSWGGKLWFATHVVRSMCQMTGRGMRSADDFCTTYILDAQFGRFFGEWKNLFPKWWQEALALDPYNPKYRHLYAAANSRREEMLAKARIDDSWRAENVGPVGGIDISNIPEEEVPF